QAETVVRRGVEVANAQLPGGGDRRLRLGVGDFPIEVAQLRAAQGEVAQGGASFRQRTLGDGDHLTRTYDVSRGQGPYSAQRLPRAGRDTIAAAGAPRFPPAPGARARAHQA